MWLAATTSRIRAGSGVMSLSIGRGLDACNSGELGAARRFRGEEAGELGGRFGDRLGAERRQLFDEVGMLGGGLHGRVQLGDEVRRHALRAPQRVPEQEVQAGEAGL